MDLKNKEVFDPQTYWERRLSHQFNLQGVGSRNLGEGYNSWLYRVRRSVFLREVEALSLPYSNLRILDVGAGTGYFIQEWENLGVEKIVGIDITQTAVDKLKCRFPKHSFIQLDISQEEIMSFEHQFDTITAFDVLFHITYSQDYENAIGNIFSLLNPGGYFIFSENFLHGKSISSDHVVNRNINFIVDILKDTSFQIIKRTPIFYLMNAPIDTENPVLKGYWRIFRRVLSSSNLVGFLLGATLFPLELILTAKLSESPSTELMVCKKPVSETNQAKKRI